MSLLPFRACLLPALTLSAALGALAPALAAPQAAPAVDAHAAAERSPVLLVFGRDIAPRLRARLAGRVRQVQAHHRGETVLLTPEDSAEATASAIAAAVKQPGLILAFGTSALSSSLIPPAALAGVGAEGYAIRSQALGRATLIAARGKPAATTGGTATAEGAVASTGINIGSHYAAYAVLAELGYGFLRPLAPSLPDNLHLPVSDLAKSESPRWRIRAMHIHTQHPLELTNLLQGWGKTGPDDSVGFATMLPEWESYVEWLVANRQNRVEWPLLWAESWQTFADGPERIARLRQLVALAHEYGIGVGLDVPLTFQQQHSYRLVRTTGERLSEVAQIHRAVDWLMGADFDFFGTETGTSEFTHPEAADQLAWMNEFAVYSAETYGKPVYIKVHCSTGQTAPGYNDPATGRPINFNMLPHFADSRLGILPHTVELYGLDDPAPTYGNTNFSYMRAFIRREVGTREVVYYPETAYWVGYDIDVPLFLPLYGERRLHDLRLLAADEDAGLLGEGVHAGERMDGQLNFSSGWEWGYWLNDVLAARAVWDPQPQLATDQAAMIATTTAALRVFGEAAPAVATWISAVASAEKSLLIDGEVDRRMPAAIYERGGQAYLEGFQSLTDLSALLTHIPGAPQAQTQPARLGLISGRGPLSRDFDPDAPDYETQVAPLLASMESRFADLLAQGEALRAGTPAAAQELLADLLAAARMTALRARQQHGLYDFALGSRLTDGDKAQRLATARQALDEASSVVAEREAHYAGDQELIAGWHPGPTVYQYGYLWTVHSLYYWWRDEAKAVSSPFDEAQSPCYMNIIDPVDLGFGEGALLDVAHLIASLLPFSEQSNCLSVPSAEPRYPLAGVRP